MSKIWKSVAIALFALLTMMPTAFAHQRRVIVVRSYRYYGGPLWWGPSPYWWYGPYWGPSYYPYPLTGNVKIVTQEKNDTVYVDGGYVGVTRKTKNLELRPGNHEIELRNMRGYAFYRKNVYVIAGRTIKLYPEG